MCELIRTIWPVGHGAFYTEVFHAPGGPIVVYDCGGKDTQIIQKNINSFLSSLPQVNGKPIVDMVFISHFHNDHINGLKYLLNNADVKNLIIPQIDQNALLEAYIYNACANVNKNGMGDVYSDEQNIIFQLAQEGRIAGDTNIVQVDSYNNAEGPHNENGRNREVPQNKEGQNNRVIYDVDDNSSLTKHLSSGEIISIKYWEEWWEYIPVNVFEDAQGKLQNLINELAKIVYNGNPLVNQGQVYFSRLKSYLKDNSVKQIKEVYEKVFGKNDNIYSMPLYSGPIYYPHCWGRVHRAKSDNLYIHLNKYLDSVSKIDAIQHLINRSAASLYTGDFEPCKKIKDQTTALDILKEILKHRWCRIGLQQIPHHASSNNHSNELYDRPKLCYANVDDHGDVSFSQSVIRDIIDCKSVPFIVTELDEPIDFYFDIWYSNPHFSSIALRHRMRGKETN